jgi:hypothetical protein
LEFKERMPKPPDIELWTKKGVRTIISLGVLDTMTRDGSIATAAGA